MKQEQQKLKTLDGVFGRHFGNKGGNSCFYAGIGTSEACLDSETSPSLLQNIWHGRGELGEPRNVKFEEIMWCPWVVIQQTTWKFALLCRNRHIRGLLRLRNLFKPLAKHMER
jgi:hypothetical protein